MIIIRYRKPVTVLVDAARLELLEHAEAYQASGGDARDSAGRPRDEGAPAAGRTPEFDALLMPG